MDRDKSNPKSLHVRPNRKRLVWKQSRNDYGNRRSLHVQDSRFPKESIKNYHVRDYSRRGWRIMDRPSIRDRVPTARQSESQMDEHRRTTVAERLLQSFPAASSTSGHNFVQPSFHQEAVNRETFVASRPRQLSSEFIPRFGTERLESQSRHSFLNSQSQNNFASASNTGPPTRPYLMGVTRGAQGVHANDPHSIDPRFMPGMISRIANVAGRPVGSFYSTRASEPPKTEHVATHRPNSKIRFSLPGENEISPEEIMDFTEESPQMARENLKKLRQWERTTLGHLLGEDNSKSIYGTVGDGTRFTVLNYNVLAPSLLETHMYLYKNCNPKALEWEYRLELFLQEVTEFKADVVCLQEVEAQLFPRIYEPLMAQKGFKGVYKKRTRDKEDGCAIFWKQSLFSLIGKLEVEYYQPHVPLLDRDNVGLLVKLQSKLGKRPKLVVATTHILYNPKRNDVKLAQIQLLLSELDRFAFAGFGKSGETLYNHMILTGDFNADPFNSIVRFITDGELQYLGSDGRLPSILLKNGMKDFIPTYVGISDQCQHYKILMERYKIFRATRKNLFEFDLTAQAPLVNLFDGNVNTSLMGPRTSISPRSKSKLASGLPSKNHPHVEVEFIDLGSDEESGNIEKIIKGNPLNPPDKARLFDANEHSKLLSQIYKSGMVCTFGSGELSHKLRMKNVYAPKLDRIENNESIATTRQGIWTCVDYMFYSMQWSDLQRRRVEGSLKLIRRLGLMTRAQCKENGHLPSLATPSDHFPLVAEFILK